VNALVLLVAVFFAGMGLAALVSPSFIWAPFGVAPSTPASRNEVRAVYGGFGLAVAGLLVAAEQASEGFREGALVAVAVALAGMAAGRLVGLVVEPAGLRGYPALFLGVELGLAGALLVAV
jgi:ABC-type spermidine/putrescine transport system permease subunit II